MNNPQENKLNMYLAVQAVCDKKQALWQALVALLTNKPLELLTELARAK